MIDNALNIYTDGSSIPHPRSGGIGFRFITYDSRGEEVIEDVEVPGYQNATNNQMELYACIAALKEAIRYKDLTKFDRIAIYTDSQYVVDNYRKAMFEWPKTKWRTRFGPPVLNPELWKELVKQIKNCQPLRVDIRKVKGHSNDLHNRAVDKLAKKSAKRALNKPIAVVAVRRKITSKSVETGSVKMHGQRLKIRIITSQYLSVQRVSRYKYEVISKGSNYFGNVDFIFSTLHMGAGHHYEVVVNKDSSNPTVTRILQELERQPLHLVSKSKKR
jgi:ribonuclease HI